MANRVHSFLELMVQQGGSDLHLVSGMPPCIRMNGLLHRVRFRDLSVEDVEQILAEFMTERQTEDLQERFSVDFGYQDPELGRFRVNAYRHARGTAAAFRFVPPSPLALDSLGLPPAVRIHTLQPKGLTLVTGPTGSGKSTTLAAMVDLVNQTRRGHIITIEDPIEFVHEHKGCVVTQREIGIHAPSFSEALRHALREDPDVILLGELRDMETIALALTAAETGIQVFGTLHTSGATRTVDRIVNVFPARRQEQIRSMLADSLRLIVSQQLARKTDGSGRVLVAEVLVNTHAAATMIRTGNAHKLESVIQSGGTNGMQSLDATLKDLVRRQVILPDEAYAHALDKAPFERLMVSAREAA
jgi:twitching motility protein PilT